jgi:hypothetical protein
LLFCLDGPHFARSKPPKIPKLFQAQNINALQTVTCR